MGLELLRVRDGHHGPSRGTPVLSLIWDLSRLLITQAFFAERAWRLWGKPLILSIIFPILFFALLSFGIALKITSLSDATKEDSRWMLYALVRYPAL